MMATVNTNVAGDVPSAIQIRPDLTHLGSHCLTMLTEWLQFQDLQPLSVVHGYVKHQLGVLWFGQRSVHCTLVLRCLHHPRHY